jgi:prolyl oligopeptidase
MTPKDVSAPPAPVASKPTEEVDAFSWLESIDGEKAISWVKEQDTRSVKALDDGASFQKLKGEILEVLDSDARIPGVMRMGEHLYNFWKDKTNPRGLWRRTTLAEYRKDKPRWEVLIDVDALGKAEKESWVWHGATCLKPEYRHCLVMLSRGGADAHVVREYDLKEKRFVEGGFVLPEAKSDVSWITKDELYVATDFGPGSLTDSSYARIVKTWRRGAPLTQAKEVFAAEAKDMAVSAWHDATPGFERDFVSRQLDFYTSELYQRTKEGDLVRVEVPLDAQADVEREWLLIHPRSAWKVGEVTYASGSLLAARFDDFMAGKRKLTVLFTPNAHESLSSWSWTRHHLLLSLLKDVVSEVVVLNPGEGEWKRAPLGDVPALSEASAYGLDPDHTDEYLMESSGFLSPTTLARGVLGKEKAKVLKHLPAFFDASGLQVTQAFATSKDGTKVPYFVVSKKGLAMDGKNPTLLYGYGGFEVSLTPVYSGSLGRAWLSRGGVYVQANIRGGGEYGPAWHKAALKENRLRAYEDFAAVAQDLISRGITSSAHLGIHGGSNGGLLMGNMLTRYPELFGAVLCEVALLDMKRYPHLSAGSSWMAEYGDPDKPEEWSFIRAFSPYHNVKADGTYPPVLFTTSTRDDRVGPVHARKMAAKMMSFGQNALFYENVEGGHGAAADNAQQAFMRALGYRFLWSHVQ